MSIERYYNFNTDISWTIILRSKIKFCYEHRKMYHSNSKGVEYILLGHYNFFYEIHPTSYL